MSSPVTARIERKHIVALARYAAVSALQRVASMGRRNFLGLTLQGSTLASATINSISGEMDSSTIAHHDIRRPTLVGYARSTAHHSAWSFSPGMSFQPLQ